MSTPGLDLGTASASGTHRLMPNLFVIGASKTGSSALHAYLKVHPKIFMSAVKEPCFFVDQPELENTWPAMARNPVSHDQASYLDMFLEGQQAKYRGEASVYYSQFPHKSGVPDRIASASPQAKIVYVIREPVSRAISHYWQRAKEFQEPLPLEDAVRENALYRDTSDYEKQLDQYLKVFDRDQIHIIVSEDLRYDRRATLGRLFNWLDLEPYDYSDDELADVHVSPAQSRRQRFGFVRAVRDSEPWQRLRNRLPDSVLDGLRRVGTKSFDKAEVDERDARDWLKSYFKPRVEKLETLIGQSLENWD